MSARRPAFRAIVFMIATLLLCCVPLPAAHAANQPEDPIMGILTQPNIHSWRQEYNCDSYVQQTYVDWLRQVGVRAVPVRFDMPRDEMTELLGKVQGVLFTGGMQDLSKPSPYYNTGEFIYNYTIKRNLVDKVPFVLWGTCQGFQFITVIASGNFSINPCDYAGTMTSMLPLDILNEDASASRLFANLNTTTAGNPATTMYQDMTLYNSTANAHDCGIDPEQYTKFNRRLKENYNLLSVNKDTTGRPFASTFEHISAEVYGVQWHPEAGQFWFGMGFNRHPATIRVSQFTVAFVTERLRMNKVHRFPSEKEAQAALVTYMPLKRVLPSQYVGFYCLPVASQSRRSKAVDALRASLVVACMLLVLTTVMNCVWYRRNQQQSKSSYSEVQ